MKQHHPLGLGRNSDRTSKQCENKKSRSRAKAVDVKPNGHAMRRVGVAVDLVLILLHISRGIWMTRFVGFSFGVAELFLAPVKVVRVGFGSWSCQNAWTGAMELRASTI